MRPNRFRSAFQIFTPKIPSSWSKLDSESLRQARLLNTLLNLLTVTSVLVFINVPFSPNPMVDALTTGLLLGFVLLTRWLLLRGQVHASAILLTGGLWLTLVGATFINQFEGNSPFVALALVVIVAGLLLGSRAGFLVALLSIAIGFAHLALTQSENTSLPVIVPYNPVGYMVTMSIIFIVIAGLIYLATSSLKEAIVTANRNEKAMAESNRELQRMRDSLEDKITERTRILEQRTRYLQTAIEVSRATSSILDTQVLIQNAVDRIRDQFELYYVGLFLLDPTGQWAVLQAGTGDAGRAMLSRGHRIRYGQGMIGWCIAHAQPRLSGEVDDDMVRLPAPELPNTRSEAAIPLSSRGCVLGALTVQSNQPDAFGEIEITTFQALADQLAIALDNTRLIAESQQALKETQRAYGQINHSAWTDYLASKKDQHAVYRYGLGDSKTSAELDLARRKVLTDGNSVQAPMGDQRTLLLPIMVRDQVIGVINFTKGPDGMPIHEHVDLENHPIDPLANQTRAEITPLFWNNEEVEMLNAIADQLGVALDSARLYAETRQLAERERIVDQVSSEMRASLEIDTVLETAVRELRDALGLAEVEVRLGNGA